MGRERLQVDNPALVTTAGTLEDVAVALDQAQHDANNVLPSLGSGRMSHEVKGAQKDWDDHRSSLAKSMHSLAAKVQGTADGFAQVDQDLRDALVQEDQAAGS